MTKHVIEIIIERIIDILNNFGLDSLVMSVPNVDTSPVFIQITDEIAAKIEAASNNNNS